ncbi:MAG: site-specific integrase [Nitrososphaera sp.]
MAVVDSKESIIKSVNTINPVFISDEDHHEVRWSEHGKKMTEQLHQTTTATYKQTKKAQLLADPDVKRWYDNTARGSKITAEMRLRRLSHFCELHRTTPMQLVELAKDLRAITDLIQDHITMMEEKRKAPGYIESIVTAIKSWLRHFDIEIRRRIKIDGADSTPTLANEKVPEGKELAEIFDRSSLRAAVEISLIAKAGLRPQVLGNHDGTDGLVLGDIPDIVIENGKAACNFTPMQIVVRRTISKARHQYFTFLTERGTRKLLAYLNDRLAKGERLDADSPVIAPDTSYNIYRGANQGKKFLPTRRISKDIRDALRPRFRWRPYVFRAFFDTQLLMAESRGKMVHDFRVFMMGHKGSMESRYTTNKGVLPNALVTEMRSSFKKSQQFLDLEMQTTEQLEIQSKEKEIMSQNLTTTEQPIQIVVSVDQVEKMISQGWRFLATLPGEKAVFENFGFRTRDV